MVSSPFSNLSSLCSNLCRSWVRCAGLLPLLVLAAAPAAALPSLNLLDGKGQPLASLAVGESLFVSASGLSPNRSYQVRLFDGAGTLLSYFQLTSSSAGGLEPAALWYHSGIDGCTDAGAAADHGPGHFTTFEEARAALAGQNLSVALFDGQQQELARVSLGMGPKAAPTSVYVSDAQGCLRNGFRIGAGGGGMFLTLDNLPPATQTRQLAVFVVADRTAWPAGTTLADVRPERAGAPQMFAVPAGVTRLTIPLWDDAALVPGAYDAVVRLLGPKEAVQPVVAAGDWITDPLDTGVLVERVYGSPCAAGTEIAATGRLAAAGFPAFEPREALQAGEAMWSLAAPLALPANQPDALYAALYVVAAGSEGSGLADMSEGIEILPVKPGTGSVGLARVWNAPRDGAYDLVVDLGAPQSGGAPWTPDNAFNPGVDFRDRETAPGLWVIDDPAAPGSYAVLSGTYGPGTDPADPLWTDVSAYFDSPAYGVPYTMDHVPLRGRVRYPTGNGPFPLVLIVHGNAPPDKPSDQGYDYLLDLLASRGMIAVSVDETFLNGASGEMDARAIVLLRHLQRWRTWNTTPGFPLAGKVDLDRIGLAGHSRGGEAATVAWLFNQSLHNPADPNHNFGFHLRSIFAIAPVDGQIGGGYTGTPIALSGVDYFVMHGSHDGDVYDFPGQRTFDRAFPVTAANPGGDPSGDKGLLFVHGANHAFWNTVWTDSPDTPVEPSAERITPAQQQAIGKAFVSAFFQYSLQGKRAYKALFVDAVTPPSLPAGVTRVQQFQDRDRLLLNHFEEDVDLATGSQPGVTNSNDGGWLSPYLEHAFADQDGGYWLWQQTRGLIAGWNRPAARFDVNLAANLAAAACSFPYLALRVGQVYEPNPVLNAAGQPQDFSLRLGLGGGIAAPLSASGFATLPYPEYTTHPWLGNITKTVLQTVRIPLFRLLGGNGLDLKTLQQIQLLFDRRASGLLAIDDVQLTR